MSPDEAKKLISKDPKNRDVLFPYINGEDLNTTVDQSATRWVINFKDWPLDRDSAPEDYEGLVASDYPDCLAIVLESVKPERDRLGTGNPTARDRSRRWWQFARPTVRLYDAIGPREHVLALCLVTQHVSVGRVDSRQVFAHKLAVFPQATDSAGIDFAILQSSIHDTWARKHSSSLETRLNYSPSDCFETFPFPGEPRNALIDIGQGYDTHRRAVMQAAQLGLTKIYNRFHKPDESAEDITELRRLHTELDRAVVRAYGWDDLIDRLAHGFYETRQGVRFTVCEAARRELLDRLLALNHERYAAEVEAGLHDKPEGPWYAHADKSGKKKTRSKAKRPTKSIATTTPSAGDAVDAASTVTHAAKRPRKQPSVPDKPLAPQADPQNQTDLWGARPSAPATTTSPEPVVAAAPSVSPPPDPASTPENLLLAALRAASGPQTKAELLAAARLSDDLWPAALAALKRLDLLATEGSGRGTRYRLADVPGKT